MIKGLKELMDIFSEEIKNMTAYPKEPLTHYNRSLGMSKCEIITVVFLLFG